MIFLTEFKAEHLKQIELQEAQAYLKDITNYDVAKQFETDYSFTGIDDTDGTVFACGGIFRHWHNRGEAWMYISKHATKAKFLKVHRTVKMALEACSYERIEMLVDCDFKQGHRWAEKLGFRLEAERMRKYRPDGKDCALYARVK